MDNQKEVCHVVIKPIHDIEGKKHYLLGGSLSKAYFITHDHDCVYVSDSVDTSNGITSIFSGTNGNTSIFSRTKNSLPCVDIECESVSRQKGCAAMCIDVDNEQQIYNSELSATSKEKDISHPKHSNDALDRISVDRDSPINVHCPMDKTEHERWWTTKKTFE